jgi:benzoate/toluate 1,2-dioxygenase subunit beta
MNHQNPDLPYRLAHDDIRSLLAYEAQLLNELRFTEWLRLYTENAVVWVPARADQENPEDQISLIYDDRELLELRIKRLAHPLLHSQDPMTRSVRLIGNSLMQLDTDPDTPIVRSDFIMLDYRQRTHRFLGGTYLHELREHDGQWRIAKKTVRLINCDDYHSNLGIPL